MKYKFNDILWTLLFSWIVIFGTVYANANCHVQGYSRCAGAGDFEITSEGPASGFPYEFQCGTVFSFSPETNELCCRGEFCQSEGKLLTGTHYPKIKKQSDDIVSDFPRPPNKGKALNVIFGRHKTDKTIPIYTLTQSFLC